MIRLSLALLGGFRARLDDQALAIGVKKSQALLAYLAVPLGQAHPRDKLAALLWGDMREPQARAGLRQTLFERVHVHLDASGLERDGIAGQPQWLGIALPADPAKAAAATAARRRAGRRPDPHGRAELEAGGEALESYRAALALAEELGMAPLQARCALGLAAVHRRLGQTDDAREQLAYAVAMLEAMQMRHWLGAAEALIARDGRAARLP